jgi:hypothetical protein
VCIGKMFGRNEVKKKSWLLLHSLSLSPFREGLGFTYRLLGLLVNSTSALVDQRSCKTRVQEDMSANPDLGCVYHHPHHFSEIAHSI